MSNSRGKPILIVLIAGIGDLVLGSLSFRALRNGNPNVDIHLLTTTDALPIATNYDYLDYVWTFPMRELRRSKSQVFTALNTIRQLRKINFGTVVNLYRVSTWSGSILMGLLFMLLGAQNRIGHSHKGFGLFLSKTVPSEAFNNRHIADAMLELALIAGGLPDDKGIEVFFNKKDQKCILSRLSEQEPGAWKTNIGINPGGERKNRRWNAENYAFMADHLLEKYNARIVLLAGPGEEPIARQIQDRMKNDALNLAGKLTLNELIGVVRKLDLLITNDSGPMHIAAAVKTPLVAIFGPENPALFGPYTTPNLYRVINKDVDCRPCQKKNCGKPVCLDLITPEEVLEKCVQMLER